MKLADYHTHTPLCQHAAGHPKEYAAHAATLGLAEIGISDHNPMPERFDEWRMLREEMPAYFAMVEEARASSPIPVRLGMECDFLPGREGWIEEISSWAEWDYLIGSVHYILPDWDVDNPTKLSRWDDYPVEQVWDLYWSALAKCAGSGLFDFIAHPDLVKKFGRKPAGDLRGYYEATIAAAASTGTLIELSTAGLRKECRELYPASEFLLMAKEAGLGLVINSDAHSPGEVGMDYDKAVEAARAAGFDGVWFFQKRKRTFQPFDAKD